MFCNECGEQLSLVFRNGEGLVPYCNKCREYRFPYYATAVCMVATNREANRILLARHDGDDDFLLFAGYIKKGESAEKTVSREFKEETKLNAVKYRYMSSRYIEDKNILMFNYIVVAENGEPQPEKGEIAEERWFTFDEALSAVRPGSAAEYFLRNAVPEIQKGV